MPTYNPIITQLNISETRRYAGLHDTGNFSEQMLRYACTEARILANPQGIWQVYPYDAATATINALTPLTLQGNSIKNHLSTAVYISILCVTIGGIIEEKVTEYFTKGEYTKGLLLDAAGTTAVEAAADQVCQMIAQHANKLGCQTTFRFSPGYGDWNVTIQPVILDLSDAQEINVSATLSAMLTPRKSITAVIGFTPYHADINLPQTCIKDTCLSCNQINCLARKEK